MLAWCYSQNKFNKPGVIMAENILAGERASADWYDESSWNVIPAQIRKAGGLVIQDQEEQENQSSLVAIRILKPDETITHQVEQWWQSLLGQLQMDMPQASFTTWVRDTFPVHFEDNLLQVAAKNKYAQEWLESRLSSTAIRLLAGIANQSLNIQFVVGEELPA